MTVYAVVLYTQLYVRFSFFPYEAKTLARGTSPE